jgi:hypothetical protein
MHPAQFLPERLSVLSRKNLVAVGAFRSFLRHGDLSARWIRRGPGASYMPTPGCSSVWMSRNRLFLGGLVSTRARLRFTGWS